VHARGARGMRRRTGRGHRRRGLACAVRAHGTACPSFCQKSANTIVDST
jgi:hypothetical protein